MQRRWLRLLLCLSAVVAGGVLLYNLRALVVPFGSALLLAYLIQPLVRILETRGVDRVRAILTVYAAGAIISGIFFTLFIPALFKETKNFALILPVYGQTWQELQLWIDRLSQRAFLPPELQQILLETLRHFRSVVFNSLKSLTSWLVGLLTAIPSLILAPFLAYYMLRDYELLKKRFLSMLPPGARSEVLFLLRETDRIFSRFLRGHLLISLIVGLLTGLGAALIGLPFSIMVGIFTALADLVPIFGPVIAAVPVVGLALVESRTKGFFMLVVYLLVQQLEGSFLAPRLLGDSLGLHPLAVVLVLLMGGYLFGPLGLIFGVPLVCLLRVVGRLLWEKLV